MRKAPRLAAGVAAAGLIAASALAGPEPVNGALSLSEAILRAQAANTSARLALEGLKQASAQTDAAHAALLPQLTADASEIRHTVNLKAQGFQFPGLPTVIGPFNTFDARLRLSQTVLDFNSLLTARGAGLNTDVAGAQLSVAKDEAASIVSLTYINVLRNQHALSAAESDRQLAEELLSLAQDQRKAGIASGVDVARAETAVAQRKFALAQVKTGLSSAWITLKRVIGATQTSEPTLAEELDFNPLPLPDPAAALNTARLQRPEMKLLKTREKQLDFDVSAAKARRLPSLGVFADYGIAGNTPHQNDESTYAFGARVSMPIFSGGAITAGVDTAESKLNEVRIRQDDLDAQIEQDVRVALANADSGAEQVRAAQSERDLADRELTLARDRFAHGVASNVEVVEAQASLSRARAGYVDALAAYHVARLNLAAALGEASKFQLRSTGAAQQHSGASP